MNTKLNAESNYLPKVTRVLPDWMTKLNTVSPPKNKTIEHESTAQNGNHVKSPSCKETVPTRGTCLALTKEQDVEEESLHRATVSNGTAGQPKAHQLSEDEAEVVQEEEELMQDKEVVQEEEVLKEEEEEEVVQEEQLGGKQLREGEDDVVGGTAEEKSPEEAGCAGEGEVATSGEPPAASSQSSNESCVQKITWRVLCNYGAKCYRKNPDHKKVYCHPWDADYDTVFNNLAVCPYGAGCYRKNKAHWQTHSHPPTTPPARTAKRKQKKKPAQTTGVSDLEDDSDSVDSFLNDASSDDYQPTDTDSESDVTSDGGEKVDEPDAKRMKKEAKKFLRKKK
ncbi:aprataxin and PNK-like factor [Bacillus rossius redtenbacheri]|uniref:aprataxin and PNK-like factor n=1 Tax=Bacillus rossius redtenbacheri TaxID=93214 RepID=UPI002FDE2BD5